ncbi:MAG: hypothetical protein AAF995_02005 [Planctomycetota bacterium]
MRIVKQTGGRLVLAGVVGGLGWMLFTLALGAAVTLLSSGLLILEAQQSNWPAVGWLIVGLLLGQIFFWLGLLQLLRGRERLVLDRALGRGEYTIMSPVITVETRPFDFKLDDVDGVALEMRVERSRPGHADRTIESEAEVWRVRLRTREPRRAIVLDETHNGQLDRVRTVALAVAEFLGVDLVDTTEADGAEQRASASAARTPIAARRDAQGLAEVALPQQPEPVAWDVDIDAEEERIVFTRLARGGPPVFGCFLLVLSFIGAIAALMGALVWINPAVAGGGVVPVWGRVAASALGGVFVFVVVWTWASLLRGTRRVVVSPDAVRSVWLYPGRGLVTALPGASRLLARGESLATGEVTSVKQVSGSNGRALEVRAGARRLRICSDADAEQTERAELKWLGASIRAAVRLLGV